MRDPLWIKESSVRMVASAGSLSVHYNWKGRVVEVQKVDGKVSIRYFTSQRRLSFENDKLFDMHALSVLKGEEAKRKLMNELKGAVEEGVEDLSSLALEASVPTSLPITFIRDLGNLYVDERRVLDFGTKSLEYDLGREFLKDRPGLTSERRLKLTIILDDNRGLKTVHWLESGRGEVSWTEDLSNWNSDLRGFLQILSAMKPTSEAFRELKKYMLAFSSPS